MVQKQTACDWADLVVVLAVRRHATVRAASRALGISHSTVLRRLETIEKSLGARLFDRLPDGGYELTPAGQDAVDTAQHLEEQVTVMERRIHGRDLELAGPVHLTMVATLFPVFVDELARFCATYPKIELSIAGGFAMVDLAHREADVALRFTDAPSPELVGRKVADATCGVYGSAAYLDSLGSKEPPAFVGWDTTRATPAFARWIAEHVPSARVRCRITQDWQIKEMIDADLGVSVVPCALGGSRPHWRRVRLIKELTAPLWVLTHKDLRATARARAVRDFIAESVTSRRALFEGRGPGRERGGRSSSSRRPAGEARRAARTLRT